MSKTLQSRFPLAQRVCIYRFCHTVLLRKRRPQAIDSIQNNLFLTLDSAFPTAALVLLEGASADWSIGIHNQDGILFNCQRM